MRVLVTDATRKGTRPWRLATFVGAVVIVLLVWPGAPSPGEVAAEYERAADQADWAAMWEVSSPELRADMTKAEFVSIKERNWSGSELVGDLERVVVEREETWNSDACVVLRIHLRDAGERLSEMLLREVDGAWKVVDPDLAAGDCPLILNYLAGSPRGRYA